VNKSERHARKEAVVVQPKATTQQLSRVTEGGERERERRRRIVPTQKCLELGPPQNV